MSAQILNFSKRQNTAPEAQKTFLRDQAAVIRKYDWDAGETEVPVTVIQQKDDWVSVRGADVGCWSVHVSVLFPVAPEAA